MTKSIEEQANDYPPFNTTKESFIAGAKARDAQWQSVVNELRDSLNCIAVDVCFPSNVIAKKAIIKADQMLKEMSIK